MKGSELLRKLRAEGCHLVESRTNHDWWYSTITERHFAIPRHRAKEIPKGTLKNISKASGVEL